MATRAERFKAEAQRRAQANKVRRKGKRRAAPQAAAARAALVARHDRLVGNVPHNAAPRAEKNSAYEIEVSGGSGRPSRKSTRKSPTHIKTDSNLRIREMNRNASPKARSVRRSPNPT
jgi:hypothetical protein